MLRATFGKPSFVEFLFICWACVSIFFLLVPGKETVAYWATLGCLLTLVVWGRNSNNVRDRIGSTVLIAILIPLGMHVLIGFIQVAYRLYVVAFIGVFEHPNWRAHVSIGVKNLSIACIFCALVGHQIARFYVRHRALGLTIIALSMTMIGLLNSLIGAISYLVFVASEIAIKKWGQKGGEIETTPTLRFIPNEVRVGALALLLAFPFSGGLVRIQQLPASLMAVQQKEIYRSWVEPANFVSDFCPSVEKECKVNASTYYRLSWAIFGLQTLLENPMGLGNVERPLQVALQKKYPKILGELPDDFHSELVNFGVRFGVVFFLIALTIIMWMYIYLLLKSRDANSSGASLALGFLTIIFIRLAGDSIGRGGVAVALSLVFFLSVVSIKFEGLRGRPRGR